jgi:hypothetical protein
MPIYEFHCALTGRTVERVFTHSERPAFVNVDGEEYYYTPSVPAAVHSSAGTWNGSKPDYKAIHRPKEGKVIREAGMEADAKYNAKRRYDKSDKAFEKAAGDAVRDVMI